MRRTAQLCFASARYALLVSVALGASGCGYALSGRGVTVDPSIKVVGVPLFRDSTGRPGLDEKITTLVISELLNRGRFQVIQETTGVDAIVDGELTAYSAIPVGFGREEGQDAQTEASRYRIVLLANVRYAKVGESEAIWESPQFRAADEYDIGDAENFFDREEQAIDRLAKDFARQLVAAMLEAF